MKKTFILCALLALAASGCVNSSLIRALAKDPATAHMRITTIYGTVEISRTSPTTNTAAHKVSADGGISVGQ